MQCPFCQTENRDDQEKCYHCDHDLSMLRLIVNKAKHHFNQALELAERGHDEQAIVELRNALDLDVSLVDARVVLGTLYAKQEKFEEARACWADALATDHRYQKAHDYLAKAQVFESALPALEKHQQTTLALVVGFAGMTLLVIVLVAYNFSVGWGPAPGREPGRGRERGREGERASMANAAFLSPNAPSRPERVAPPRGDDRLVQGQLQELASERLDLAEAALANADPALALELVERVKTAPGVLEKLRDRVSQVQAQALDQVVAKANAAADFYFDGKLDAAAFDDKAGAWIKLAGDAPQAKALAALRQKVVQAATARLLADANAKIARAPLAMAARAAEDLRQRRPDLANQLDATLNLRLDAEDALLAGQVKQMTGAGRFAEARARVAEMGLAYRLANRTANAGVLETARREIDRREAARKLADADAALAAKQWPRALELAGAIDAQALDPADRGRLAERVAMAQRGQAEADWQWFQGLDPQFGDGRVSTDDARHATAIYRQTIEHLAPTEKYARGAILFYAAVAHWKLGQRAEAAALIKELESLGRLPGYVKASLKDFVAVHGAELGAQAIASSAAVAPKPEPKAAAPKAATETPAAKPTAKTKTRAKE